MKSLFCLHSIVKVAKLHHSLFKDKNKRNMNLRLWVVRSSKHNPDFGVSKLATGVANQTISFIWPFPSLAPKRKINCSKSFSKLTRSSQWLRFFPLWDRRNRECQFVLTSCILCNLWSTIRCKKSMIWQSASDAPAQVSLCQRWQSSQPCQARYTPVNTHSYIYGIAQSCNVFF